MGRSTRRGWSIGLDLLQLAVVREMASSEGEAVDERNEAAVPEKLADDVVKPPLWKEMLYRVFPALERSQYN